MTTKPRFKIDFYDSVYRPFCLCFREPSLWGESWKRLDTFETRDQAKAHYDKIKDLPEYLP